MRVKLFTAVFAAVYVSLMSWALAQSPTMLDVLEIDVKGNKPEEVL